MEKCYIDLDSTIPTMVTKLDNKSVDIKSL